MWSSGGEWGSRGSVWTGRGLVGSSHTGERLCFKFPALTPPLMPQPWFRPLRTEPSKSKTCLPV